MHAISICCFQWKHASHCWTDHVIVDSVLFILTSPDRKTTLFQKEVQSIADLWGRSVFWGNINDDIVQFQWQIAQNLIFIRGSQQIIQYDS